MLATWPIDSIDLRWFEGRPYCVQSCSITERNWITERNCIKWKENGDFTDFRIFTRNRSKLKPFLCHIIWFVFRPQPYSSTIRSLQSAVYFFLSKVGLARGSARGLGGIMRWDWKATSTNLADISVQAKSSKCWLADLIGVLIMTW